MIVVTGGAGFIGSVLAHELAIRFGHDLVICDRFDQRPKWRNLNGMEIAEIVHPEDLLGFLDRHRAQVRAIFHLGAVSSTTVLDSRRVLDDNFIFSCRLWDWCADHRCRLVYASSAATYGDGQSGFDDASSPEFLATLRPRNLYGWSKHLFDRRVARHVARGDAVPPQWVGLKFFNVYGPNEYHKEKQASVILSAFHEIRTTGRVSLFRSTVEGLADGEQKRDFVWVGDCVEVMLWLLEHPHVSGLYNVGTGLARSFNDLGRAVFAAMNRDVQIDYIDMPERIRDCYQSFTQASIGRLRAAGFDRPLLSLEQGVSNYVQEHLDSLDPYL